MQRPDNAAPTPAREKLIVHIYFTPFNHETRARRSIDAALEAGFADRVESIGYKGPGQQSRQAYTDTYSVRRFNVDMPIPLPRLISRTLSWLLWSLFTIIAIRRRKPLVVQVHAIAALPAAVFAKWLSGTKILYDSHDLETERTGWTLFQRKFSKVLERMFIHHIDGMITVSDMIADWYVEHYGIRRPALVRNIPVVTMQSPRLDDPSQPSMRKSLGIPAEDMLFIYIGAMDDYRGVQLLVDAFKRLPSNYHFCTLGYGTLVDEVKAAAAAYPNIHHHDAIPGNQVPIFIRDADVGTCLIEDVSMNHRYTLPNKLFETRHGGLAVLVSDLPAIAGFVAEYGGGWTVDLTVDAIVERIASIDKAAVKAVLANAKPVPTWDDEKIVYLEELRTTIGA